MASKTKKEKVKPIPIGDQILLEVASKNSGLHVSASLYDFVAEHSKRISALVNYGYLRHEGKGYWLTDHGKRYIARNYPERKFEVQQ